MSGSRYGVKRGSKRAQLRAACDKAAKARRVRAELPAPHSQPQVQAKPDTAAGDAVEVSRL